VFTARPAVPEEPLVVAAGVEQRVRQQRQPSEVARLVHSLRQAHHGAVVPRQDLGG
jgi:hypothetical protein